MRYCGLFRWYKSVAIFDHGLSGISCDISGSADCAFLNWAHVVHCETLNTYRTAVSPTLDLLCHEDFNVGRSEAESNIEIFMAQ